MKFKGNVSDEDGGGGGGEVSVAGGQEKTPEEDEEEWNKFQQDFKKENQLEAKSKETHQVHCPYFPTVGAPWSI